VPQSEENAVPSIRSLLVRFGNGLAFIFVLAFGIAAGCALSASEAVEEKLTGEKRTRPSPPSSGRRRPAAPSVPEPAQTSGQRDEIVVVDPFNDRIPLGVDGFRAPRAENRACD
jgi:hypothetical protein